MRKIAKPTQSILESTPTITSDNISIVERIKENSKKGKDKKKKKGGKSQKTKKKVEDSDSD